MTDMTAFERQLSSEVAGLMGPVRSVDDLAIFEAATAASRSPRWGFTMFSAIKYVVAGVIVALFGGFLLTGFLTAPPEDGITPAAVTGTPEPEATSETTEAPTTSVRTDILPGAELTVEEVEPGVFRVLHDAVRDLPPEYSYSIGAGRDGSVWIHRFKHLVRLGDRSFELPPNKSGGDLEVAFTTATDGTLWVRQGDRLYSDDDGAWTVRRKSVSWFTIAPDGTVWVAQYRKDPRGHDLARLGADGWEPLGERLLSPGWPLAIDGGEAWAEVWDAAGRSIWYQREDDGAWHEVTTLPRPAYSLVLDDFVYGVSAPGVMGSDGTIWYAYAEPLMADGELVLDEDGEPTLGDSILTRFDGGGWQRWGTADGVPSHYASILAPAPDGSVWLTSNHGSYVPGPYVDGIYRFDGSAWQAFLPGHTITSMDVAPDGSVWLLGGEADIGIYVITPEAIVDNE